MDPPPIEQWPVQLFDPFWQWLVVVLATLGLLLLLLIVVWRRLRHHEEAVVPPPVDLGIDVMNLPVPDRVETGLHIEVYGTPVRIAVIVLAPVGREGALPEPAEFLETIEQLVPGFSEAVLRDRPLIRGWPSQLSSQGFAHSFFNNVRLPGDRGKGTPWCSLVGKFTARGQLFLAGIVCRANVDNALSQYVIQHEGQWNDVLRVRKNVL